MALFWLINYDILISLLRQLLKKHFSFKILCIKCEMTETHPFIVSARGIAKKERVQIKEGKIAETKKFAPYANKKICNNFIYFWKVSFT